LFAVRICLLAAAAAVAAACGPARPAPTGPTPPAAHTDARLAAAPPVDAAPVPVPLDRDMVALAAKVAELYGAAADGLVAAGTDCARATTALGSVRDRFTDVRDAIAKVTADDRIAALEPELDRHRDEIKDAIKRMGPALAACRADASFNEALEGLAPGG
jgi:hypothetical protein